MASKVYACDFETTVYDGQTRTDVWSSARVKLYTEEVIIDGCIEDTFNWVMKTRYDSVLYYHNLKFDGSFWLDFLCRSGLPQAYSDAGFVSNEDMPEYSYKYSISEKGQWYNIVIRHGNHYTEIRDSLKLMPMSLEAIGKSFETKHRKLSMEYINDKNLVKVNNGKIYRGGNVNNYLVFNNILFRIISVNKDICIPDTANKWLIPLI